MIYRKTYFLIHAANLPDIIERFFNTFSTTVMSHTRISQESIRLQFDFPHPYAFYYGPTASWFSTITSTTEEDDIRVTIDSEYSYDAQIGSPPASWTISGSSSSSSLIGDGMRNAICTITLDEGQRCFYIVLRNSDTPPVVILYGAAKYLDSDLVIDSYFGFPSLLFSKGKDFSSSPFSNQPALMSFTFNNQSDPLVEVPLGKVMIREHDSNSFSYYPLFLPKTAILHAKISPTLLLPGQLVSVNNGTDTGDYLTFTSIKTEQKPKFFVNENSVAKFEYGYENDVFLIRVG